LTNFPREKTYPRQFLSFPHPFLSHFLPCTMMQCLKSQMPSVRNGKHAHYIYTIGVFAAVCVLADLLVSFFSQLSAGQQQSTTIVVALSVSAFFAGSVNSQRKNTDARNAKAVPAKKPIQTHEGEYEARQASTQPAKRYEARQVAKRSAQERASQLARYEVAKRHEASQVAPPEVEREASQPARTAEPPEPAQKPLKAPRYASRSSAGQGAPTESDDTTNTPLGGEKTEQSEIDTPKARRVIEQARREGVEPSASTYSALMRACVRSNDKEMSLKLFDQILSKYMNCDYEMTAGIPADTRTTFFSFVAGQLDDERLRKDGLQILVAIRDHGIQPPHVLQNRLVCAWEDKPPEFVVNYFKKMREDGFTLSSAACRCILADMVSSTGEGGRARPSQVPATISQSDPTCDAEETPAATATERTPLRIEASTFVPNPWEGPWQTGPATSMPGSWAPYPPGQYDEFSQMPVPQTGVQCNECTTVMLRNLPCPFLREDLIKEMDAKGFAGLYNFVYMPIDFKTEMSLGYAFVNMITAEEVPRFMLAFGGFRDWPRSSKKVCAVDLSRTQGLDANVVRYRNSPVMGDEVPERFRPVLFAGTKRVPFPEPTVELPKVLHKSTEW